MLSASFAATVTQGRDWPDGQPCEPGGVLFCSTEDDPRDTTKPRLRIAGANMERMFSMRSTMVRNGKTERITLPDHVRFIEREIRKHQIRLVILDPMVGYFTDEKDTYKDATVRRMLAPLVELVERVNCAIIMIRHWTKGTVDTKRIHRGGGSIAWSAASRALFTVEQYSEDDENDKRRVFRCVRVTGAERPKALVYRVVSVEDGEYPKLEWSPDEKAPAIHRGPAASAQDEAVNFLYEALDSQDEWKAEKEIKQLAAAKGISAATLNRARRSIGVEVKKMKAGEVAGIEGGGYGWRLAF